MERVRDLMRPNPIVVAHDTPIAVCGRRMLENPIRHLPVVRGDEVLGILDDGAVFGVGVALPGGLWFSFDAEGPEEAGTLARPAVVVDAEAPLPNALRELVGQGIAVVTDEGRVVGVLSEHDIVKMAPAIVPADRLVDDIDSSPAHGVSPEASVREAMEKMRQLRSRHLVVFDGDERVVGVVSLRDLVTGWLGPDEPVKSCMADTVRTVPSGTSARSAAQTMADLSIGCLPVVDGDRKAIGVVTRTDLLRLVAESIDDETLFGDD